jgi:hypothetical protein
MANLESVDGGLLVRLSRWEVLGGLRREFVIPAASILSDEHVDDGWQELHGGRCPGTGLPGVIMLGTMRYKGTKDYCAVYGRRPARVISCRDFEFARVLISDPR